MYVSVLFLLQERVYGDVLLLQERVYGGMQDTSTGTGG